MGVDADNPANDKGYTVMQDPPIEDRRPRLRSIDGGQGNTAPVPHPLPDKLLPVAAFDSELMPEKLRSWVVDVAERMQCPIDYIAVSVMTAAGSVIGRKVGIRPLAYDPWTVIANMWAMPVGRPGVMKSPAMHEGLKPLHHLAARATDKFKREHATYELGATGRKIRAEVLKEQAKKDFKKNKSADIEALLGTSDSETPPTLKRYIANDTTVEALGELLQQNPNGLLAFRDEMLSLLDSLDQEEHVSQKGFYLTGWNGDSTYTFDRIGRGLHLTVDAVCLSLLGSTQPGRISQYLSRAIHGGKGDDGLIQRFGLLIWPDIAGAWTLVDRLPNSEAMRAAYDVFKHLDELDWRSVGARRDRGTTGDEEGIPYLRFDNAGNGKFAEWRSTLERRLRSGELHPALESHLAKYRKLVPGLALICHLADGGTGAVTEAAAVRAIAWATYLETHAQRAYGSVTAAAGDTARDILAKIWDNKLQPGFTARDIWKAGWSRLTDRPTVQKGLDLLVDYDWLTVERLLGPKGGAPSLKYTLSCHPAAANPV